MGTTMVIHQALTKTERKHQKHLSREAVLNCNFYFCDKTFPTFQFLVLVFFNYWIILLLPIGQQVTANK